MATATKPKRSVKAAAPAPTPKRKAKSKARPVQTESKRGPHVLLKRDVDAWKEGARSPRARHNARIVEQAFRLRDGVKLSQSKMDQRMDAVYGGYRDDGNGITINHPNGIQRVMFKKDHPIVSNENAERAAVLLNEYHAQMLNRTDDDDERSFLTFISGIIQRSKAGIRFNSNIKAFMLMKFTHPDLREAQRLLAEGFESKESKLKVYCQRWNAEDKEWISE